MEIKRDKLYKICQVVINQTKVSFADKLDKFEEFSITS